MKTCFTFILCCLLACPSWAQQQVRQYSQAERVAAARQRIEGATLILEEEHRSQMDWDFQDFFGPDEIGYRDPTDTSKGRYVHASAYTVFYITVKRVLKGDASLEGQQIAVVTRGGGRTRYSERWGILKDPTPIMMAYPAVMYMLKPYEGSVAIDHGDREVAGVYAPSGGQVYGGYGFIPIHLEEQGYRYRYVGPTYFKSKEEVYDLLSTFPGTRLPPSEEVSAKAQKKSFAAYLDGLAEKRAVAERNAAKQQTSVGLTVGVANQTLNSELVGEEVQHYYEFDLMVRANSSGTYLENVLAYFDYNTAAFGQDLAANGRVSVTPLGDFATSSYEGFFTDITSTRLAVTVSINDLIVPLTEVPTYNYAVARVRITLGGGSCQSSGGLTFADVGHTGDLCFYNANNVSDPNSFFFYSPVNYHNPPAFTLCTTPNVGSLSSTGPFIAGNNEVLTIYGSGFGTAPGDVLFRDAQWGKSVVLDPGPPEEIFTHREYLQGIDPAYITYWSDTRVDVIIPSLVKKFFPKVGNVQSVAASGQVKVRHAAGAIGTSSQSIDVRAAHTNHFVAVGGEPNLVNNLNRAEKYYLAKRGCTEGLVFTLDPNVAAVPAAVTAIETAMADWEDALGFPIRLERDAAGNLVTESHPSPKNNIHFDNIGVPMETKDQGASDGSHDYLLQADIAIKNTSDWYYPTTGSLPPNRLDFYRVFTHELGHALQLDHSFDSNNSYTAPGPNFTLSRDMMYWAEPRLPTWKSYNQRIRLNNYGQRAISGAIAFRNQSQSINWINPDLGTIGAPNPNTPVISTQGGLCGASGALLSVYNPCSGCTYQWSNGATGPSTTVWSSGNYTVTARRNGCAKTSASVYVGVATPPTVTAHPQPVETCVGGTAVFNAAATGTAVSYQWQWSPNGGYFFLDLSEGGFFSGVHTSQLTLNGTFSMNNKLFRCKVYTTSGVSECASYTNAALLTETSVSIPPLADVYVTDFPVVLPDGVPAGGDYSGPGVTPNLDGSYNFNPSAAGLGTHTLTYSHPDCGVATASRTITVQPCCGNSISLYNFFRTSFCLNGGNSGNVSISFSGVGTYNNGNVFRAQLSDANGDFTNATIIGALGSSATGVQTITAVVPQNTPAGTGYRIRVVSSVPYTQGSDNGQDIEIKKSKPGVSCSTNPPPDKRPGATPPGSPTVQADLYPNPSRGSFEVALRGATGSAEVQVVDIRGRTLYQAAMSEARRTISLPSAPNGMYFVRIRCQDTVITRSVTIMR